MVEYGCLMRRHDFNHFGQNAVQKIAIASKNNLQKTNIPQLGKRKIIFKSALVGDMLVPRRVLLVRSTNLQSADVLDPRTMDLVWLDTPGALGLEAVRGWPLGMDAALWPLAVVDAIAIPATQQFPFWVKHGHRNYIPNYLGFSIPRY